MDKVRDAIERTARNLKDERWRIVIKRQGDLWDDGVKAGAVLTDAPVEEYADEDIDPDEDTPANNGGYLNGCGAAGEGDYAAGKWGRYLRAPDLYIELMERFKNRFVPMGELVEIRRGITSGCDAFFMPKEVTELALAVYKDEKEFRKAVGIPRGQVVSGKVRIVQDGAGTYHPIEPEYIRPEVHSLMKVDRPVVRAKDLDRVVVLVKSRRVPGSALLASKQWHDNPQSGRPAGPPSDWLCAASPVPPFKRLVVTINAIAEETSLDCINRIFDFCKLFVKPDRSRSRCGGHANINPPSLLARFQHGGWRVG